ncbi:MAG: glutamate 5-kinase [Candidatus Omnitrophica bacterium]|nr:glutamate 5-kinase [Candidatus Omnitrophota bacterium]
MSGFEPARIAQKAKRWVIKVGTSELTDGRGGKVTQQRVQAVASHLADLWKEGKEAVLVTSGAIGIGMGVLELKSRPKELAQLQAAAATGQSKLMQWYTARLEERGFHAAQVLLTREDMEDAKRRQNVKATLETLLRSKIVPIINENDTVSTEEIRYGDNDILSARVALLIQADVLVLLTDVEKLIGPTGEALHRVDEITPALEQAARGTDKESSTGGMKTKIEAAKLAMGQGIPLVVMTTAGFAKLIQVAGDGTRTSAQEGTWFVPAAHGGAR